MILNRKGLDGLIEELKRYPERTEEIMGGYKLVHALFAEGDGIPPRFGSNFREEGPKWEKVSGLDFEAIGRILVCHLCIEHYLENLITLSTSKQFDWDSTRMTFSQKFRLVSNISVLKENRFGKGIEILNSIRNKLSHNMLASVEDDKVAQLKAILVNYQCEGKDDQEKAKIVSSLNLFGTYAIIENFTSLCCAMIAGYCTGLINKKGDAEDYYKHVSTS